MNCVFLITTAPARGEKIFSASTLSTSIDGILFDGAVLGCSLLRCAAFVF